jgi:hypothetical protein
MFCDGSCVSSSALARLINEGTGACDCLPQPYRGTPGCGGLILTTLGDAGVTGLGDGILDQTASVAEVWFGGFTCRYS